MEVNFRTRFGYDGFDLGLAARLPTHSFRRSSSTFDMELDDDSKDSNSTEDSESVFSKPSCCHGKINDSELTATCLSLKSKMNDIESLIFFCLC